MPRRTRPQGGRVPGAAGRGVSSRAVGVERVDERLVAALVPKVRAASLGGPLETAQTVGELVLEAFYGGDLEVFAAVRTDHASVQALARDDSLGRPPVFVFDALRYLEQKAKIPPRLLPRLSYSHHKALFRVLDLRLKLRLAAEVAREGLSAAQLAKAVTRELGEDQQGRGRAPAHPVLAAVKGVGKVLDGLDESALRADDLEDLSPRRRAHAAEAFERYAAQMNEIAARLRAVR